MAKPNLSLLIVLFAVCFSEIHGHGKMVNPINRSSVWRLKKFAGAVENVQDNENFCGGRDVQINENDGKCGPCGDNYKDPVPRKNENGGVYGKGFIVKKYRAGETVEVKVDVTANHLGHFEFNICRLKNATDIETEECFNEYPLTVVHKDGTINGTFELGSSRDLVPVQIQLPKDLTCERCVLRWHYRTGNHWGWCDEQKTVGRNGCGPQEHFRSCADVAIL